jgi:hypothetical protein
LGNDDAAQKNDRSTVRGLPVSLREPALLELSRRADSGEIANSAHRAIAQAMAETLVSGSEEKSLPVAAELPKLFQHLGSTQAKKEAFSAELNLLPHQPVETQTRVLDTLADKIRTMAPKDRLACFAEIVSSAKMLPPEGQQRILAKVKSRLSWVPLGNDVQKAALLKEINSTR